MAKLSNMQISDVHRILVVQTAFLGDVVLTLPLIQSISKNFPATEVDCVVIPSAGPLLEHHPAIHAVILYDKRHGDSGVRGLLRIAGILRQRKYDLALVPHRSLRSAVLVRLARIPERIGFDRSAGRFFFSDTVAYDPHRHEIDRNLSLLGSRGSVSEGTGNTPDLYPGEDDVQFVDALFEQLGIDQDRPIIGIAPGTVWNTKRWPEERFAGLAGEILAAGDQVLLLGGAEDEELCRRIARLGMPGRIRSIAGACTLLQSAEAIRRCRVLVSNDSAPMHLAVAVKTPVVGIFGATIPGFGFAPRGPDDTIVEVEDLSCRPCSIHGGKLCPIGTFDCMQQISAAMVYRRVRDILSRPPNRSAGAEA